MSSIACFVSFPSIYISLDWSIDTCFLNFDIWHVMIGGLLNSWSVEVFSSIIESERFASLNDDEVWNHIYALICLFPFWTYFFCSVSAISSFAWIYFIFSVINDSSFVASWMLCLKVIKTRGNLFDQVKETLM